jgi:glycosyltransferase involved in cell wall biosynthesis
MHICYVLLSPTFGMHQYTADLANRMSLAGYKVSLVTTTGYPVDRYLPAVEVQTPVTTRDSGFSTDAMQWGAVDRIVSTILTAVPDMVHITGPHIWNIPVMRALQRQSLCVVHTLHDLDPHPGSIYGPLLHQWNRSVLRRADHILVHGRCYLRRLEHLGVTLDRITFTPLLHLFAGQTWLPQLDDLAANISYEPFVLLFGRLERYKGVRELLTAWPAVHRRHKEARLVLAGPGQLEHLWADALPPGVEVRSRLIRDDEAIDLFRRCALLVLPYIGATQSALIPAAYYFSKSVIATRSGALPEYVQEGTTGWIIEPGQTKPLAETLARALDDMSRLVEMGRAAQAWYAEQRPAEEDTLLRLYTRLVEMPAIVASAGMKPFSLANILGGKDA